MTTVNVDSLLEYAEQRLTMTNDALLDSRFVYARTWKCHAWGVMHFMGTIAGTLSDNERERLNALFQRYADMGELYFKVEAEFRMAHT
jgi:hypothetical protein